MCPYNSSEYFLYSLKKREVPVNVSKVNTGWAKLPTDFISVDLSQRWFPRPTLSHINLNLKPQKVTGLCWGFPWTCNALCGIKNTTSSLPWKLWVFFFPKWPFWGLLNPSVVAYGLGRSQKSFRAQPEPSSSWLWSVCVCVWKPHSESHQSSGQIWGASSGLRKPSLVRFNGWVEKICRFNYLWIRRAHLYVLIWE